MFIKVIDTVEWSRFNWDRSWEKSIDLDMLLPQTGIKYEIPVCFNQAPIENGTAYVIWKPPHSDLNGWSDKRPSEILKSYVIKGEVKTLARNPERVDFIVTAREKLTDAFENLAETQDVLFHNSPHALGWHKVGQLKHARVGGYIYISGGDGETWLEAILSRDNEKLCLHYSAYRPGSSQFETVLLRTYLSGVDLEIIEKVIKKSVSVDDNSFSELTENQVFGAEYQ